MRLILLPVAERPECHVALDAAFEIASAVGADVAGYHLRPEQYEQTVALPPLMPDDDVHAAFALADPRALAKAKRARILFDRCAAKHGFASAARPARGKRRRALWHEAVGSPARVWAVIGPVADLTVVSRPTPRGGGRAQAFLLGALLHSVKPVLILPAEPRPTLGRHVAIAWDRSPDAAAAVAAALPLLTRADRVSIVQAGRSDRFGPKTAHLARYLAHWNVETTTVRTPGERVEREIERACRDLDADLVVMGAYSRSRFQQLVFGGVTEHMLFKTELPVLMLHR
jgi:nucleotide-binding universal stress UspA family protein